MDAAPPPFERYDPDALMTLFHARAALSEHGGRQLLPQHLLLGVLQAKPDAVLRFASSSVALDDIRQRILASIAEEAPLAEGQEVPSSVMQ